MTTEPAEDNLAARKALCDVLASFVQFQRIDDAVTAILACKGVVSMTERNADVKREIDWQHHWLEKFQKADLECNRLQRLIDMTEAKRVIDTLRETGQVPQQRTTKHDDGCWKRHAGCLAQRIQDKWNDR